MLCSFHWVLARVSAPKCRGARAHTHTPLVHKFHLETFNNRYRLLLALPLFASNVISKNTKDILPFLLFDDYKPHVNKITRPSEKPKRLFTYKGSSA